jgi:hypothetical protein
MSLAKDVLNRKVAFDWLTLPEERHELLSLHTKIDEPIKLRYRGKQECPGIEPIRLWDIETVGHPYYHSTRSLDGLKELGII